MSPGAATPSPTPGTAGKGDDDGGGGMLPCVEIGVRSEVNSELNFSPNFEGLVLVCIDADFCK